MWSLFKVFILLVAAVVLLDDDSIDVCIYIYICIDVSIYSSSYLRRGLCGPCLRRSYSL